MPLTPSKMPARSLMARGQATGETEQSPVVAACIPELPVDPRTQRRASGRTANAALLVAGAVCLALLVDRIGARTLWEDLLRLGWGAAIIVAVAVLEHALHTAGWRRCFSRGNAPSWPRLFSAFLARYAVSFATPTAIVGGEVARG